MGIADRLRDAARPTNMIEAVDAPVRSPSEGLHGASPNAPAARLDALASGAKKPAYASEPESISKAFYIEDRGGERHYYDDYQRKGLAMRATDTSISSKREDLNTVKAMLDVASSRGWATVEVKGSAEFKREAWIEAQARGVDVRGYRASELDQQEVDRRRAERGPAGADRGPVNELRAVGTTPASSRAGSPAATAATSAPLEQAAPAVTAVKGAADRDAKGSPDKAAERAEPGKATLADNRRTLRDASAELSSDGRLVLAAMAEKIDRQMNRHNLESKTEMKAYVATELVKKERAEGPVVLSAEQKRTASAPEPARAEPARPAPEPVRRMEQEPPRRSLSR